MVEQIADGDRFSIGRKFRKEVGEVVVVVQFAVASEEHDGRSGELLGERCQTEIRFRIDRMQRTQIGNVVPVAEYWPSVVDDENRGARSVAGFQRREDGVDRSEEHTSELQSLRHLVCRLL